MKQVRFVSLLLVSNVLKKARFLEFDTITVITGIENTTGKSSIVKSLYFTLGADVVFEDEWLPLEVKCLLRFELDGQKYSALRNGSNVAFFDSSDTLLISTGSITRELSPFISKLFDFELPLVLSSGGEQIQAIPAFLYLPFYIDQDNGWTTYFSSFNGLRMFNKWQDSFKNYHTGIRPKEFYELNNRIKTENDKAVALQNEEVILSRTKERVGTALNKQNIEIDVEQFRAKLEKLISEHNNLKRIEDAIGKRMYLLADQKYEIEQQIQNLSEQIEKNGVELANSKDASTIVCPKCGSIHETKMYHDYALVTDTHDASEFLVELEKELGEIKNLLKVESERYEEAKQVSATIQNEINSTKSDLTLNDVLNSLAKIHADEVFEQELATNRGDQDKIILAVKKLEDERKKLTDKKRTKKIKDRFIKLLSKYFHDLSVDSSNLKAYRPKFTPPQGKLKTGSRGPRQMLALYYAFVNTVYEFSTTAKFPVVVDSPKQQEQDLMNSDLIGKFCVDNLPEGAQLILATLNYLTDRKDVKVHVFNEKKGLLQDSDYTTHLSTMSRFIDLTLHDSNN